jgi:hypothetical protein
MYSLDAGTSAGFVAAGIPTTVETVRFIVTLRDGIGNGMSVCVGPGANSIDMRACVSQLDSAGRVVFTVTTDELWWTTDFTVVVSATLSAPISMTVWYAAVEVSLRCAV